MSYRTILRQNQEHDLNMAHLLDTDHMNMLTRTLCPVRPEKQVLFLDKYIASTIQLLNVF